MHRKRRTYGMAEGLLAGLSTIFLAIYFFLVVPGYFNSSLDFAFLCFTYFSLYFSTRYLILPYVSNLCRYRNINLVMGFLLLILFILTIILTGSWLWGGLEWSEDEWDIENFWHE